VSGGWLSGIVSLSLGMENPPSSRPIAVRVSGQIVDRLDALVVSGIFRSRSAAVRAGVEALLRDERSRMGREIAEGYRRLPTTKEETLSAMESTRESMVDVP
jgi:Arc/MetJ-type ribon-helix-helix transcriptional regulator